MQSEEIRKRFLEFFKKRGHTIIPSASLVPENDPTVLFNTAGMQPLVPYLTGLEHPAGQRLVNVQKCVRTQDILEVGDNTHDTFFEMMGNWSLGDPNSADGIGQGYFKKEALEYSFNLLTSKEEGFGLDISRLYITVFAGNNDAPRDNESARIWMKLGISENRIYFLEDNWWSPGDNGPCGPDSEMFYDLTTEGLGDLSLEEFKEADHKQEVVEIWNDVFMEYEKESGKVVGKLAQKNVDTGAGLERVAMVLQNKNNIFETDLFAPIMSQIDLISEKDDRRAKRIVADHIRTAVFMISDGVLPSNKDQGYVLRRLIRRARYYLDSISKDKNLGQLVSFVVSIYKNTPYQFDIESITKVITDEETKFADTLSFGKKYIEKVIEKNKKITGDDVFLLFSTYGYPFELIKEIAGEHNLQIDEEDFKLRMTEHQEISRQGRDKKFKGGLADDSEASKRYHTATHLLHQALRDVLGEGIEQKGSNITPERLRFDFSYPQKLSDEEKSKVEAIVNDKIKANLPVQKITLSREEAEKTGARRFFGEKYGEVVSIYYIGETLDQAYAKEFCGGPHIQQTGELGLFKIIKEEAVASGTRRIKAVLA